MRAVYKYWDRRKNMWRHAQIIVDRMEEVEEFLTHTKIEISRVIVDGKEIKF